MPSSGRCGRPDPAATETLLEIILEFPQKGEAVFLPAIEKEGESKDSEVSLLREGLRKNNISSGGVKP